MRDIEKQVKGYNDDLKDGSVEDILRYLYDKFGQRLGMISGFGYSGMVLMHHLYRMKLDIGVYFIDTGYHFPETLELVEKIRDLWGLNITVIGPDEQLKSYLTKAMGKEPWKANNNLCCHYCKVGPLLKELPTKDAWISAIRRDQTYSRSQIDKVEIDGRGTLKFYPLADWSKGRTWSYIRDNDLPYNLLHDKGFMSVGCRPCTQPVSSGEDEREGRWKSTPKFDCGIHVHNEKL